MATHLVGREAGANGSGILAARPAIQDLQNYIVDRLETGDFTVDRALFTDPALFELEMKYIFEGGWIYLAHESQLSHPHDFYTTTIGRQPILLMRDVGKPRDFSPS